MAGERNWGPRGMVVDSISAIVVVVVVVEDGTIKVFGNPSRIGI